MQDSTLMCQLPTSDLDAQLPSVQTVFLAFLAPALICPLPICHPQAHDLTSHNSSQPSAGSCIPMPTASLASTRTSSDMLTAPLCSQQGLELTHALSSSGVIRQLMSHVHLLSLALVGSFSHSQHHTGDICRPLHSCPLHSEDT